MYSIISRISIVKCKIFYRLFTCNIICFGYNVIAILPTLGVTGLMVLEQQRREDVFSSMKCIDSYYMSNYLKEYDLRHFCRFT